MKEQLIKIISDALENEDVDLNSNMENITEWDSLGQLGILSALDKATKGEINNHREFNTVTSVKEILDLLEKNNINL